MITDTIIKNSIGLIRMYLPNLLQVLTEKEFENFIRVSYDFTEKNGGGTKRDSFIVTFFKLVEEHQKNNSNEIRNEFGYFNYLIGEFIKLGKAKAFKDLIISSLNDFSQNRFIHILGEIAACLDLSSHLVLQKYEQELVNRKQADFFLLDKQGKEIYVDVVTIEFDKNKYQQEKFSKFIDGRLQQKFEKKTLNLPLVEKQKMYIYPILYGFTVEIIKQNASYLRSIENFKLPEQSFQSFSPRAFGNIQGTFFNLFTIEEIEKSPSVP